MRRIIRVFPRRTKATPTDHLAYFGPPDFFAEARRTLARVRRALEETAA